MSLKDAAQVLADALRVEYSVWYRSEDDVKTENLFEREYGFALTKPGFFAQRRKSDKSGYLKARRFDSREARDAWLSRDLDKVAKGRTAVAIVKDYNA